ncbi:MAG: MBL fold metallo-hydrolase [Thermomicrobiales bacterium]
MTVRATVVCENTVFGVDGALAEHGWSAWLETRSGSFLFDTGSGRTLLNNVLLFSVPIQEAQGILLSHHHNDHTGGLLEAVQLIRRGSGAAEVPIYGHPDLFKQSFYERKGTRSYSALPLTRGALETAGARFDLAPHWREIAPGVALTGEVPRRTSFEPGDQTLKHYDDAGNVVVDPIRDDQTVVIDTPDGLFVVLGCSHAGLINILTYITEQTGVSRFHTVMGGTHLGLVDQAQTDATIAALRNFDIGRLGAAHCTGPRVASRLVQEFGDRFFHCSVGLTVQA